VVAPPEPETAEKLGRLMNELMSQVYRRFAGDTMAIMAESGLTMTQMVAMQILRYGGPQSIGGLVERLKLSMSATSHLVDRLVEKGFVDRKEDPDDRRQKRVAITESGAALIDQLASERNAEFTRALSTLDPDLREQLVVVFERAIAQLAADPCDRPRS
jgi:DNA-binding MarR family transcriptional regulator